MGSGRFDPGEYRAFSTSTIGRSTDEVFASRGLDKSLDPKGVAVRESRDSADNPNSTPLIVALDVTGSMGRLADVIAREGLGTLFTGILDRKPIPDPHVMFMGIGDAAFDRAPLQVSQFEADKRIIEQLATLWLEHGGGGNTSESYNLAWYFAALHTEHDSIAKRAKRGYLFTVGDENPPHDLTADQLKKFLGDDVQQPMTSREMLDLAQRKYDVFHVVITEGHAQHDARVIPAWRDLLGQRVIVLDDHRKLAETIVSAIEVTEGASADASASGWGSASAGIVHRAVGHLSKGRGPALLGGPSA